MTGRTDKNQVILIAIITAVSLIGDSMLYVVLPTHWQELGIHSIWEVGVLLSVNRFVRLPLNPFVGWLYTRMDQKIGILISLVLAVITTASYSISSFWWLLLMRCTWGLAWTFLRIGSYVVILNVSTDHNRGHLMGTYNGISRLGSLFGMLVGGLLTDLFGIKIVCALFAAITVLGLPLAWIFIPKKEGVNATASPPRSFNMLLWKNNHILSILLLGLFVALLFQGLFTSTLSRFIDQRYPSVQLGAFIVGAATMAGVLQALRWSWEPWLAPLFGKYSDGPKGRRPILLVSLISSSLLFALTTFQIPLFCWFGVLTGIQLTATILTTVADALASDIATITQKRVEIMTAYSVATDLGAALGPIVGYFFINYTSISSVYWLASIVLILLFVRWILPVQRKTPIAS